MGTATASSIRTHLTPRIPRNLSGRLLLTYVTLMLVTAGSLIVFTGDRLAAQTLERHEHDLVVEAEEAAVEMGDPFDDLLDGESGAADLLKRLVTLFAQREGARVVVLDQNLKMLFSSDDQIPPHVENDQVELVTARRGSIRPSIRWDQWRKEERLFVAADMLKDGTQVLGFVQLSVPTAPIHAEIMQIWLSLLGVGGIVLAITTLASVWMARQVAIPLQTLTSTTERIAAGRLDERVSPTGPEEVQRLGSAFNRMTERVQAMLVQQRAFVDNAAHELRSPLTSLRLHLDLLKARHREGDESTRLHLREMEREVDYLQRMVSQLLALSSVVESERVAPKRPLDLSRLLYQLADEMNVVAQQAGLSLDVDVPDHLPLHANAEQMMIMLRNLVDNAFKYNRAGGTVVLAARASDAGIEIRVTDTGIGIPADALPHIFERFYRADQAHSRQPSASTSAGAGLGLALVQAIVQANGGRIQVESRIKEGSTFTVYLPIQ